MTGTIDLSRAQLDTIAVHAQQEPHPSGLAVTRVVIHPLHNTDKAVAVVEHVLGYGTIRYEVARDGRRI